MNDRKESLSLVGVVKNKKSITGYVISNIADRTYKVVSANELLHEVSNGTIKGLFLNKDRIIIDTIKLNLYYKSYYNISRDTVIELHEFYEFIASFRESDINRLKNNSSLVLGSILSISDITYNTQVELYGSKLAIERLVNILKTVYGCSIVTYTTDNGIMILNANINTIVEIAEYKEYNLIINPNTAKKNYIRERNPKNSSYMFGKLSKIRWE